MSRSSFSDGPSARRASTTRRAKRTRPLPLIWEVWAVSPFADCLDALASVSSKTSIYPSDESRCNERRTHL